MTEISDELLVAYVDGQLARNQSKAIERVLENDVIAARRVETLREAHGRLEAAFESMLQTATPEPEPEAAAAPAHRRRGGFARALGTMVGALVLIAAGIGAGYVARGTQVRTVVEQRPPNSVKLAPGVSEWQQDFARVHSIFGRASVEMTPEAQGNPTLAAFQLGNLLGDGFTFPDLTEAGLTFRRAEVLNYGERKVAQIVFVSGSGMPVALYISPQSKGSETPTAAGAPDRLAWTHDGLGYLVAGTAKADVIAGYADAVRKAVGQGSKDPNPADAGLHPGSQTAPAGRG